MSKSNDDLKSNKKLQKSLKNQYQHISTMLTSDDDWNNFVVEITKLRDKIKITSRALIIKHLSCVSPKKSYREIFLKVVSEGKQKTTDINNRYSVNREALRNKLTYEKNLLLIDDGVGGRHKNFIRPTYAGFIQLKSIIDNISIIEKEFDKINRVTAVIISNPEHTKVLLLYAENYNNITEWFFPGSVGGTPTDVQNNLISFVYRGEKLLPTKIKSTNAIRFNLFGNFRELNTGHKVRFYEFKGNPKSEKIFADTKYSLWAILGATTQKWFDPNTLWKSKEEINIKIRIWSIHQNFCNISTDTDRLEKIDDMLTTWKSCKYKISDLCDFYKDNSHLRSDIPDIVDKISKLCDSSKRVK